MDQNSNIEIRLTVKEDLIHLKEWFREPGMLRWFPIIDNREINDATDRWLHFCNYKCSYTASYNGVPCGVAALYLTPYKKLVHQCEWGIILSSEYQHMGVGKVLSEALFKLAKDTFDIEMLHLQVYEGNAKAQKFFKKIGFKEFGRQTHWIKEGPGKYRGRIFMEKFIK